MSRMTSSPLLDMRMGCSLSQLARPCSAPRPPGWCRQRLDSRNFSDRRLPLYLVVVVVVVVMVVVVVAVVAV